MNKEFLKKYNFKPDRDGLRDRHGNYMSNNLFIEKSTIDYLSAHNNDVPYTLKHKDLEKNNKKYYSLYAIYMESIDDYRFAITALGSYQHFKHLLTKDWFINGCRGFEGFNAWREEKEMMRKSLVAERLEAQAALGNMQAIKEQNQSFGEKALKGRPSKEDKERHIKENQEVVDLIKDMKRSISKPSLKLVKKDAETDADHTTTRKRA